MGVVLQKHSLQEHGLLSGTGPSRPETEAFEESKKRRSNKPCSDFGAHANKALPPQQGAYHVRSAIQAQALPPKERRLCERGFAAPRRGSKQAQQQQGAAPILAHKQNSPPTSFETPLSSHTAAHPLS